jgi:hypothetical protein
MCSSSSSSSSDDEADVLSSLLRMVCSAQRLTVASSSKRCFRVALLSASSTLCPEAAPQVSNNVCQIALMNAQANCCHSVVFIGSFFRHNEVIIVWFILATMSRLPGVLLLHIARAKLLVEGLFAW